MEFTKKYLDILNSKFSGLNLTRILDPEEFELKQYQDSIEPLNISPKFKKDLEAAKYIVDIGFGGGFPLLPLAWNYPDKNFFGFEAKVKKVKAVEQIANDLGLNNVKVFHHRIENLIFNKECLIVSKAVMDVDKMLGLLSSIKQQKLYFYKGSNFKELEDFSKILTTWDIIEEKKYSIDSGQVGRYLIGLKNKNVPCGTTKKKNLQMKFFSDFSN